MPLPSPKVFMTRSLVLRTIRSFFYNRDFIEVETPVRLPAPALETNIDAISAGKGYWLRTSPELHMKRLLAAGIPRLFQMGSCFRLGERGRRHHEEFTLLEWYRAGGDYEIILQDTRELLIAVATAVNGKPGFNYGGRAIDLAAPWHRFTVREIFQRLAHWDPVKDWDPDRFDLDLVNVIEPNLPRDRPCVLMDYPAPAAALARLKPGHPEVAERWEVYLGGLELANAYSELRDVAVQKQRFAEAAEARRAMGHEVYPPDEAFLAALPDMPPAGGIAVGIDRLVMLAAGLEDISLVRIIDETPAESLERSQCE